MCGYWETTEATPPQRKDADLDPPTKGRLGKAYEAIRLVPFLDLTSRCWDGAGGRQEHTQVSSLSTNTLSLCPTG